jgi:Zn-dependent protease with chaperone function
MANDDQLNKQMLYITEAVERLSEKAKLRQTPEVCISKSERFASVNVFKNRISVGRHLLCLWQAGKFTEKDMEATLAHEIGHLMDFRRHSPSSSFRNLLAESLWFGFGVIPLVMYILFPSFHSMVLCGLFAIGWGFSLPLIVRRVEVRIELEADRNAALYLVNAEQLADALVKIGSFGSAKALGFTAQMAFIASMLTHPTFKERVRYLQNLQQL